MKQGCTIAPLLGGNQDGDTEEEVVSINVSAHLQGFT